MMKNDEQFIQECKNAFGEENVFMAETEKQALAELAKREAKRKYQREWRRNNPDKVKAQNDRYWKKRGKDIIDSNETNKVMAHKEQEWRWISVFEQLPRHGQAVIFMEDVSGKNPRYMTIHWGFFSIRKNGWAFWEKDCEDVENVIYWLPQPKYPGEDE